ncbi:MAG: sodium-dependent transporter [Myxococcota bacterium]|nr:sodium-dependent transporter [Myxococcota bacterium]
MATAQREQWSGRLGFVLAAIGSAVGLGNMWRFSYLAAENGGAAFMILYVFMTLGIGMPILLAEMVIGRGARRGPIGALAHFGGRSWQPLGWLFVAAGFLILAYYSVIAGWTLRYALHGLLQGFEGDAAAQFDQVSTGVSAVSWHLGFMAITVGIVMGGVKAGIERTALVVMPLLFVIVAGLALYAATLDGAGPGYAYYLSADFSKLLDPRVLTDAAGQAFFSLSLGMGAILTYSSYLDRSHHLPNESATIAFADFGVAFVAGLVVFPLIFALGLEAKVGDSTVGALFITLPHAFESMGDAGRVVGVLFFAALVVGALTSAISLLEVVVATAIDSFGWSRPRAALVLGVATAALGIWPALDLDVLGRMDYVAGNLFLVGGGLALAVFVGWIMDDPIGEVETGAPGVPWFALWRLLLRAVAPLVLAVVLYYSLAGLVSA